jgi:hypothetical protein
MITMMMLSKAESAPVRSKLFLSPGFPRAGRPPDLSFDLSFWRLQKLLQSHPQSGVKSQRQKENKNKRKRENKSNKQKSEKAKKEKREISATVNPRPPHRGPGARADLFAPINVGVIVFVSC